MSAQHLGPDGPPPTAAVAPSHLVVGVLGVIAIRRDDALVALPGARARLLLAALAVRPGRARSAQSLVDEVWGDQPPRAPMNALHTQVSRLRALLPDGALEIGPAGYRLTLPADSVDLTAATGLARRADDFLATGETTASLAAIATARALWRGEPGADLPDSGPADDLRTAAGQLHRDLDRTELAAHTHRGDFSAAIPLAAAGAAAHPLDESAHTTLIRLLAAAGRSGDALETFAAYRLRLIEELGADPGPTLLALNTAVLRGDPIELPGVRSSSHRAVESRPSADRAVESRSSAGRSGEVGAFAGRSGDVGTFADRSGESLASAHHPPEVRTSAPSVADSSTADRGVRGGNGQPPDAADGAAPPGSTVVGDGIAAPARGPWASVAGGAGNPAPEGWPDATTDGRHTSPDRPPAASDSIGNPLDRSNGQQRSLPLTAAGLRAAPNELLGRAADLDAIAELVHRSRVTTVLGPGGTGKTRVANAVGARLVRSLPVVLVELASVQPESVAGSDAATDIEVAIAHVLGLGEVVRDPSGIWPGRQFDAGRMLREALAARPTLLILDNCEHVIDAAAELVADLVGACAQLTVLTTSRSPLAITAESVYPLAPLAIDAAGSPATELFSARARAVRPDVRLDPDTVARLCRTLDGLPLAIELAAARVRTMSVAEIETRLEHRFALLRSGDRAAPHRHRTLHAVIAWSWNLLDPDQQVALRRLSRFPAGFTLSAAEVVAAGADVVDMAATDGAVDVAAAVGVATVAGAVDVAAAVDGLVGQSLLTVLDDPDGAGIRYRMLETVREFGAEQLAAVDAETDGAETALVNDRMARWAREFAIGAARDYRAGDQVAAVIAVTAELDNLVAVLRSAADRADAPTAYSVFPVVAVLWVMRGSHLEFTGWALRLVAIPPPAPSSGEAADLQMIAHLLTCLHMLFPNGGAARPVATVRSRARRLTAHPDLDPGLRLLGRLITVRPRRFRLGRLFAEGARSPDPHVRIAAWSARANFWENAGNVVGSAGDALHALADLESADVWGTAMVCQHLAQVCGQSARYGEAVGYYRRALELMGRLRVHEEIMESRCYLASALIGSGQQEQARAELDFALRHDDSGVRLVDDPAIRRNHRLATAASAIAELELADGDIDAGLRHYRRALALLGWPDFEPTPGPGALMISAATVSAHVLHGRADAATDLATQIIATTEERLSQYFDLPQIGAVACALGSYLLATGTARDEGLELLTLARTSVARQDGPSMELARHVALHRRTVGDAAMDLAVQRAAGVRRMAAATRIIELISGLRHDGNGTRP
ncbi:BTAD domain-containing putative transcriptional regulator [Nocardia sp. NPDC057663]|uniref:AfsR/SARP family transcriptional regulator n=1 Tax=Nocardia sp. NPDC057663 TaxID=3346201 RepID=UPI00366B587B